MIYAHFNYAPEMETKKKELTRDEQISKSCDYMANVFTKQGRVMPFELVYGDGSIHGQLTKEETKVIYDTMANYVSEK